MSEDGKLNALLSALFNGGLRAGFRAATSDGQGAFLAAMILFGIAAYAFHYGLLPQTERERRLEEVAGDIYVAGSNLNQAMHGDRVVARIERISDRGAEGRIVRILQRGSQNTVGRFDVDESGMGFVVPFDRRLIMDVQIPSGESRDAKPGDMVTVDITKWPTAARGPLADGVDGVVGRGARRG